MGARAESRRGPRRRGALLLLIATLATPAAGGDRSPRVDVTVFAAASLRDAFGEIAGALETQRPDLDVESNFAGTSMLVQQVLEGARADVFASADEANMARLATAGALAAPARVFAANGLAIVVPRGNPKRIASLADLTAPGLVLAFAAPAVPAGRYAAEAFRKAGLAMPPASQETDVKAVVGKAALGEIDAGVAYVTDVVAAAGAVESVPIPAASNVVARYPIATLREASNPSGGQAFLEFVLSPAGQAILQRWGFLPPGAS
jgi:molybdate transport system substrate-binding protein